MKWSVATVAMVASEEFRMSHLVNLRLQFFAYPIPTSLLVSNAFLRKPQLGHDGSEAAGKQAELAKVE
jgi:hypothetical protein